MFKFHLPLGCLNKLNRSQRCMTIPEFMGKIILLILLINISCSIPRPLSSSTDWFVRYNFKFDQFHYWVNETSIKEILLNCCRASYQSGCWKFQENVCWAFPSAQWGKNYLPFSLACSLWCRVMYYTSRYTSSINCYRWEAFYCLTHPNISNR